MKPAISLAILLMLITGCSGVQDSQPTHTVSGVQELLLNNQDLEQLGMISGGDEEQLGILELTKDNSYCRTESYNTSEYSSLEQYSTCSYTITGLNDTHVIIELKKFTNLHDRDGSYQYESLHLRGLQGLISEDDYGDMSRFYGNNESAIYYYHLWIGKNEYLIHITPKGSKEAKEYVENIGQLIMSKFG